MDREREREREREGYRKTKDRQNVKKMRLPFIILAGAVRPFQRKKRSSFNYVSFYQEARSFNDRN